MNSGVLRDYMLKTIGSKQKPLHYKKIEKAMKSYFDWYSQKKRFASSIICWTCISKIYHNISLWIWE